MPPPRFSELQGVRSSAADGGGHENGPRAGYQRAVGRSRQSPVVLEARGADERLRSAQADGAQLPVMRPVDPASNQEGGLDHPDGGQDGSSSTPPTEPASSGRWDRCRASPRPAQPRWSPRPRPARRPRRVDNLLARAIGSNAAPDELGLLGAPGPRYLKLPSRASAGYQEMLTDP